MDASYCGRFTHVLGGRATRRTAVSTAIAGLGLGFVQVTAAREASPSASPPAAGDIQVSGHVAHPGTLTLADLQALPAETVEVTYLMSDGTEVQHTYTGARFWDVLQLFEPKIEPDLPETSLHMYVVLTAQDGYVVVLSMGEIDPEFGGYPYVLAWEEDGQALSGEQGLAMLVPPGDRTEGRYIYGIVSIEVHSVDAGRAN
jgi:DMSO/TMAO reductase YedYZ molybdopterin-dependent catalytic subunit